MSLTVGSSLGPYEITALLGAGGMGEVYRALDKRLDRVVAIKVLPSALSARPDLRERLQREARTISSLNHPNICTLFDVGETADGSTFLVMELLEGETLADRLARGAMPVRQALRIGTEIADALDRAHRKGIVHRDLKPGNVMITKTGVKLLDFGLARLVTNSEAAIVSGPDSPTVKQEKALTGEGMIVGTLQYMSPEQLEGKVADPRSDIFALGATLYEMLSGRRAFQANSRAALIADILHEDPPSLASVTPAVPATVSRLVEHCLMKEPDDRWQTARDVAIQLRGMSDAPSSGETVMAVRPAGNRRAVTALVALLLLLLLGAAAAVLWQKTRRAGSVTASGFSHVSVAISPDEHLAFAQFGMLAISPDGSKVIFLGAEPAKKPQLYLRRLAAFTVTPITGTEEATSAFFSPDGKEIAFVSNGEMKRVVLEGGTPEKIADAGPSGGGSWGSDGMIIFNPIPSTPLHKVAASGGKPVPATKRGSRLETLPHYRPELGLLFFVSEIEGKPFDEAELVAMSLESGTRKVVVRGTDPRYVARTNTLVFVREGKIWSVGFDPAELRITGTPTAIADPVLTYSGTGNAVYDVTAAGDLVFAPYDTPRLHTRILRVDRDGTRTPLPFPPGPYQSPHLSRDGRVLVLEIVGANNDVWLGDMERGTLNRLTSNWENLAPVLSPDGRHVIVSRHQGVMPTLYLMRTDGVGEPERILEEGLPQFAYSWSDDGTTVAYVEIGSFNFDLGLLRMSSPRNGVTLVRTRFFEGEPALSPDAKWIAYVSNETGQNEIYVRSTEAEGTKLRISTDGGHEPLFAHNGKELFYRKDDTMMVVSVSFIPALSATQPVRLFDFPGTRRDINRSYDVAPDDRSFVMIERSLAAENMRTIHVVRGAVN